MRKIALSIAAIAVLFVAGAQAGSESWRNGATRMEKNQGDDIRHQDRPEWELGTTPILGHHLQQSAVYDTIGAGPDSVNENWVTNKDTECDIRLKNAGDTKKMGPYGWSCGNQGHDADC